MSAVPDPMLALVLAGVTAVLAGVGVVQALLAAWLVARFARTAVQGPVSLPPVTVLKPLHGDETLLEAALTTLCRQDYPVFQIVFGVATSADPAVAVVARLRQVFPAVDIALVADPTVHGANPKVGNLINMLPAARHDVLVVADSDVHARPDYLHRLVAALEQPGTGLVTTLYAGLPASSTLAACLGATQITHGFLPGAVMARAIGRQDCLGATMVLSRQTLERIGGFQALADHLADDNVLGRLVKALGLGVVLAQTVPLTTVPETGFAELFHHELRWARTIRALEPASFAASVLQYPLAWALLTILLAGGALWALAVFVVVWVLRAVAALRVDAALAPMWSAPGPRGNETGSSKAGGPGPDSDEAALAFSCPVWLLPLRDILSVVVMLASYAGRRVNWRGHFLQADTPPPFNQPKLRPAQGTNAR
jgi:ceramide glucosyltransferase